MSATLADPAPLPRPPVINRVRSQLEAYFVLRRNPLEIWGETAYQEGMLPGRFLGRDQILLNDPEAIRRVLVDNHENYGRAVGGKRVLQPVLGEGLLMARGKAWRHQRRTIAPALAPRTLPLLARHVVAAAETTERQLAAIGNEPVELLPHLQHLALAIAGQSMFSIETASFGPMLRALVTRYSRYARPDVFDLLLPLSVRSPADRARARFRRDWLAMFDMVIDAREQRPPAPDDAPRDLFDLLKAARDPESGVGFDRAALRDEVATMILAGHETTAVTLFWSCWLAARLPEHADRIAAEAAPLDLSPDHAAAAVRDLPYTRAFIDEAIRHYPPAFMIVREALAADTVAGHPIKPGTVVSIAPWVLHRHRAFWDRPHVFDPARFLPGAPPPPRYAYMPFGAGPRICVGAQFALTEAVIVLARLLRQFRLRFSGSGAVMPVAVVTTQPDRPVRFILEPR